MATKHGHGYVSNYRGQDASAKEQFDKLSDLSRELETTYGYMYISVATAALAVGAGLKVPFDGAYLTSVPGTPAGSRDVEADVVNHRLTVRYGGMYRAHFQGWFTMAVAVPNPVVWWYMVNGVAAGIAWVRPAPAAGFTSFVSYASPLLVPDRAYVEVSVQSNGVGNTMIFHDGTSLHLQGNRL